MQECVKLSSHFISICSPLMSITFSPFTQGFEARGTTIRGRSEALKNLLYKSRKKNAKTVLDSIVTLSDIAPNAGFSLGNRNPIDFLVPPDDGKTRPSGMTEYFTGTQSYPELSTSDSSDGDGRKRRKRETKDLHPLCKNRWMGELLN